MNKTDKIAIQTHLEALTIFQEHLNDAIQLSQITELTKAMVLTRSAIAELRTVVEIQLAADHKIGRFARLVGK